LRNLPIIELTCFIESRLALRSLPTGVPTLII
ncbi:unnamed protein product, partial [marine sediment metagenome]